MLVLLVAKLACQLEVLVAGKADQCLHFLELFLPHDGVRLLDGDPSRLDTEHAKPRRAIPVYELHMLEAEFSIATDLGEFLVSKVAAENFLQGIEHCSSFAFIHN